MKGTDESHGMIPVEGSVANAIRVPTEKTCKLMAISFSRIILFFSIMFVIFNFL